jgi:hypothetical protein
VDPDPSESCEEGRNLLLLPEIELLYRLNYHGSSTDKLVDIIINGIDPETD